MWLFFRECGIAKIAKQGLDDKMAAWLWNTSIELTNLYENQNGI